VYQTGPDSIGFHYYDLPNTQWIYINASGFAVDTTAWKTTGNTGLVDSSSFFGNIDNVPLNFRQNNVKAGRIDNVSGNVFFGENAGNDTASAYVNIGRNAGAATNNTFSGVSIGSGAGRYTTGANSVNIGIRAGQSQVTNTTTQNVYIGGAAGEFNKAGGGNVAIGQQAFRNDTTGALNTAIGYFSMVNARNGAANSALGGYTLQNHVTGSYNTAIGYEAMQLDSAGSLNVAVGWRALRNNRVGAENTAIGVGALESDSSGNYNTAVGRYSSYLNKRGDFNVSLGFRASNNADTASFTTAIGAYAGARNKQDNNVIIGYAAGYNAGVIGGYDPKEITFVGFEAGRGAWASNKNTSLGFRALSNTDAGFGYYDYVTGRNTAIGDSAMAFSIGGSNVVAGATALSNTGVSGTWNNVAIGDSAMGAALSNSGALADNVAIGFRSLTQVKNQGNIAIGAYSGRKLANTIWNTAIGYHALETDTTGSENTVIGTSAFRNNANGVRNVSLGINTGYWATGNDNTYIGSYAGQGVNGRSTGSSNVAVGDYALLNARSAAQNVAIGESALGSDSTGNLNVAVGAGAMDQRLRGDGNVAVGFWAGRLDTASERNVYIGREAGYNSQREGTIAIGYQALYNNSIGASIFDGIENTAIGTQALSQNTTGNYNVAIGNYSQFQSTAPIGWNTSVGSNTLYALTTGENNTVVGSNAMSLNTTGTYNTAMGTNAMFNTTTGNDNTGIGFQSLFTNSSGRSNTAVGKHAGITNTIGNQITVIGDSADVASANLNNATAIGYRAMVGASNSMVLGGISGVNGATASTAVGIGTSTPTNSKLHVLDNISPSRNATYISGNNATSVTTDGGTLFVENLVTAGANSAAILAENENTTAGLGYGGYFRGQFAIGGEVTARATPNANTTKSLHLRNNTTNTGTHYGADIINSATNGTNNYGISALVSGGSNSNYGLYAAASGSSTTNIGVFGSASGGTTNWGGYFSGNVFTTGTYTPSDAMLKSNIRDYDANALSKIMSLQTKSYNYDVAKYEYMNLPGGEQFGFLAQDLEKLFPQLVTRAVQPAQYENGDKSGKKLNDEIQFNAVNYTGLIPVLSKAMQEQQQIIDKQQKQMDDLKKKNEQLEKDMQLIKAKLGINN
jgi:trimeric autotransporter adhesin